ncbi:hypothetical protein IGI04_001041 [Brassica rapa subsp. trilocularis]|uniref:HSF-type DNA-binding domain-containing protein n=1 Tax=Brassica rapa subsp. trilocularis TaxID=1813537 RepID=A0ABQ7NUS5_BRACM|nr:hypothetical protein IGI04_001041 [Brassica rapa subsp. trilocularis]
MEQKQQEASGKDSFEILSRQVTLSQFITELEIYGFVRIKGSEHLEFGHEQYFVRGKPDLLTKMRYQAASDRMKKSLKEAKARAEAEKNGCVGDQSPISRMMNARDARIRFNKIMRSFKAKTPLENSFLHLRI